ncbi:MAG: GGDEF domain-containing protein [Thermoanaerobaculia bacterium]|nr:GGDEF domain-containing protein [Thermoanaerobaculia bacterium]
MLVYIPLDPHLLGRDALAFGLVRAITSALLLAVSLGLTFWPALGRRAHGVGTVAVSLYSCVGLGLVWTAGPSHFQPYQTNFLLTVVVGFWVLRVRWWVSLRLVFILTLLDLTILSRLEVSRAHQIAACVSSLVAAAVACLAGYSWEKHERRHFLDRLVIAEEQALLQDMNRTLKEAAVRDSLTGLLNRRSLNQRLAEVLAFSHRYGTHASLVMVDLDGFKSINDTFGHSIGDRLLQVFAGVLEDSIRETDFAFRLGGDEFCILLPGSSLSDATLFANRILAEFPALLGREIDDAALITGGVGLSAGCVETTGPGETPEHLLQRGDRQLYRAKRSGRNRVCQEDGRDIEVVRRTRSCLAQ